MGTIHKIIPFINGGEISVPSDSSDQRLITHENNALTQADYMFRYDGKIFVRTRTREAVEDDWGEWGSWSEISGGTSLTAGTGISISNGTISNNFSNLSGVNLDDITYQCVAYVSDSCTNKPTTYGGMLISKCYETSHSYGVQIFASYANTGKGVYYRNRISGSWQGWNPLYLTAGNGIGISATGEIKNVFSNILSGDINNITYNYQGYVGNSVTNKPTTNGGGLCCIMQATGLYGFQLFSPNGTSNLYFRNLTNGTWGSWVELVSHFGSTPVPSANKTNCSGAIYLRASGQMVFIDFNTVVTCTTGGSGWKTLFTLPNGFTPITKQKFILLDDSTASSSTGITGAVEAQVTTSGEFQVWTPVTGHKFWGGTMIYLRS